MKRTWYSTSTVSASLALSKGGRKAIINYISSGFFSHYFD